MVLRLIFFPYSLRIRRNLKIAAQRILKKTKDRILPRKKAEMHINFHFREGLGLYLKTNRSSSKASLARRQIIRQAKHHSLLSDLKTIRTQSEIVQ